MRNAPLRTAVTALAVTVSLLLPAERGRAATCVSDPATVASADVAFVGRLSSVSPTGDQATFAVSEVWTSADLAAVVVVNASPGWFSGYEAGDYLVLASVVDGSLRFGDGECEVAMPWDPSYANLRPATAHAPQEPASTGGGPPAEMLFLIGVAVVLVAVSAFAFRRTRGPAE